MFDGTKLICAIGLVLEKQTATSHSAPEAEMIALEAATRTIGVPAMMLWDSVINAFNGSKPSPLSSQSPSSLLDVDFIPKTVQFLTLGRTCAS